MLSFVLGLSGSGKTEWIYQNIKQNLQEGKQVLLLVPEYQILLAENDLSLRLSDVPTLHLEVLSFRRLANRVFRTFGGLSYHYIERGAQLLVIWRALTESAPFLKEYHAVPLTEQGFLEMIAQTLEEFKKCCIRPEQLQELAIRVAENTLQNKLQDLALIYSTYETILKQDYDDPADDLTRLQQILHEKNIFENTIVYVDSFHGFSYAEQRILRELMLQSSMMYIALPLLPRAHHFLYGEIRATYLTLQRIANRANINIGTPIVQEFRFRFSNPDIPLLADSLWTDSNTVTPHAMTNPMGIRRFSAKDPFEEVEFVAQQISKEIRNGAFYREIAVVTRDLTTYSGILESVFRQYEIPFFLSKRVNLATKPLVRFLKSALAVLVHDYRMQDVIAFLKSGYIEVSPDTCHRMEQYLLTWGIEGKRFSDPVDWNMNPAGYSDELPSDVATQLDALNSLRYFVVNLLTNLKQTLTPHKTVKDAAIALYDMMVELEIPKRLQEENIAESNLIWNSCLHCLDQLVQVVGELPVGQPKYFAQMLDLVITCQTLRDIPPCVDHVMIGEASQIRTSGIKSAYIIGANEDVFPACGVPSSLLSDTDRKKIIDFGMTLPLLEEFSSTRELYYLYHALTLPSENLCISYQSAGKHAPAAWISQMDSIFSDIPTLCSETLPLDDQINTKDTAFSLYCQLGNCIEREALSKIYQLDPGFSHKKSAWETDTQSNTAPLSPSFVQKLYPKNMVLSQSKLEQFIKCPFAYHCKYVLHLSETASKDFRALDTGTFIHRVLERGMQYYFSKGRIDTLPSDEEIKSLISEYVRDYLKVACGEETIATVRMQNLFRRLERNAFYLLKNLLQEFLQSRFLPVFFELKMSTQESQHSAKTLEVPLDDGSSVQLIGTIDRVDVYKEGKQVYLRVVDYKTGTKKFSLSKVSAGLQLQMLIYLFALWQNPPQMLKKAVDAEPDTELFPAGVLYFSAKLPSVKSGIGKMTSEEIEKVALVPRSGLLLGDNHILQAMEQNLEGKYIPVTNHQRRNSPLATLEEFGTLYDRVCKTIATIAKQIKSGITEAIPKKEEAPCSVCQYQSICRKSMR